MKKRQIIILIFLLITMLVSSYLYYNFILNDSYSDREIKTIEKEEKLKKELTVYDIYIPDEKAKYLIKLELEIPIFDKRNDEIRALFDKIKEHSKEFISFESQILNIYFEESKLYLNMNKDFTDFMTDSEKELTIIYSIVNTMTEVQGVKYVKFLIDDEEVKTMGGFIDTSDFFEKDKLLVKGE